MSDVEAPSFRRVLRVKEKRIYDDTRVDDEIEGKRRFSVEEKLVDEKFERNLSEIILELAGTEFTLKHIQEHGFNTPILIKNKDGLGLRMPDPELFSVIDVKSYVGARRMLDVFDCDTHQADQMSVYHWIRYYTGTERDKILNVTSLEFSHTGLDRIIECPQTVTEDLDWVCQFWPKNLINEQKDTTNSIENMKYPKVRKYCLMSVGGCYTDFHIDFGGTSVWYHILKGSKVFWLIPPSEKNLEIYEKWMLSERQQDVFFGDLVDDCIRVHLIAGDTFMIPTGWIHGVYTPDDSLVFGGNFLHSFNIPMQLRAYDIEENTHVPRRLRYPFFTEAHWYMIKNYVDALERDMDERRILEFENDGGDADDEGGAFNLVKQEMDGEEGKQEIKKPKWDCVYLTVFELEGLGLLCERFRSWTFAKMNYPKDLDEDCMELLDRLEELLQYHEDDDQILACRGQNMFKQLEVFRKYEEEENKSGKRKENHGDHCDQSITNQQEQNEPTQPTDNATKPEEKSSPIITKQPKPRVLRKVIAKPKREDNKNQTKDKRKSHNINKKKKAKKVIRRVRCHACEGCTRGNCEQCKYCLDAPRNGGPGRMKQSCALRFCHNPGLPSYVVCNVCDQGKSESNEILMECSICIEIVHPNCLEEKTCKISRKVNNSWECPKCCDSDEAEEYTDEQAIGGIPEYKQRMREIEEKNLKGKKKSIKSYALSCKKWQDALKTGKKRKMLKTKEPDVAEAEEEEEYSSDDEPLIKKTQNKRKSDNGDKKPVGNGHIIPKPEIHEPLFVVRPAPFQGYETCVLQNGNQHLLQRKLWMDVFTHLNTNDKVKCMSVCRAWNQWSTDSSLWKELNVSNKHITQTMLNGIVRRQPSKINFSATNINGKQLEWLLKRILHLKGLDLSLNTASAVSAFMRVRCPPLKQLSLAWCSAVYDRFLTQVLAPDVSDGSDQSVSRLQHLERLDLTGCNVSNESVIFILSALSSLQYFNISHCVLVNDKAFDVLIKKSSACQGTLKTLVCSGLSLSENTVTQLKELVDLKT